MKNLIIAFSAGLFLMACGTQVTFDDEKSMNIRKILSEYEKNNMDSLSDLWSDSLKVYANSTKAESKSYLMNAVKMHHQLFDKIKIMEEDFYVETTTYPNGRTFTKSWFNWYGVGKFTKNEVLLPVHLAQEWSDGKIVAEHHFLDTKPMMDEMAMMHPKTTMIVFHKVKDPKGWKEKWNKGERDQKIFEEMGVTARQFQSIDPKKENETGLIFDISDMEAFNAFMNSPDMPKSATKAGVDLKSLKVLKEMK